VFDLAAVLIAKPDEVAEIEPWITLAHVKNVNLRLKQIEPDFQNDLHNKVDALQVFEDTKKGLLRFYIGADISMGRSTRSPLPGVYVGVSIRLCCTTKSPKTIPKQHHNVSTSDMTNFPRIVASTNIAQEAATKNQPMKRSIEPNILATSLQVRFMI
tara:strand:- start:556 stop:1026 length:471 start_codon:yes stop_codon:yes gene_type:complete